MNILLFLLLTLFLIQLVSCHRHYNFRKLASKCTALLKNLNVKGTSNLKPEKSEAKKQLKDLGEAVRIAGVKNISKREELWDERPDLKILESKLHAVQSLMHKPRSEQEEILTKNEEMLESVVKFSMLDPKNEKSPMHGKDISRYFRKGSKKFKNGMRLIYSTVIAPIPQHIKIK